jgi:hypothetical protein
MGNSPDLDHLILPWVNTRLTLIGYAPIRGHKAPKTGFDIPVAQHGSRPELEQDSSTKTPKYQYVVGFIGLAGEM